MRILHLYDEKHYPESEVPLNRGIYDIVFNLSRCLVKDGHEVAVIIRRNDAGVDIIDGIKVIKFKSGNIMKNTYIELKRPLGPLRITVDCFLEWCRVRKFLKKNDFDVIHVHFPLTACMLIHSDRCLRDKIVYTAHVGSEAERFNLNGKVPFPLKLFSPDLYLMKKVKKCVVLNEYIRQRLIREKNIEESKIKVIPNGVNSKKFDNVRVDRKFKEKYDLNGTVNVLFVGTISPRKGVEYLVKAAKILSEEGYKAKFIFAGNTSLDVEYAKNIQKYIRLHDLPVRLTGFVPYEDLMKLYVACDIFVLPSFGEGDPVALKDALVAGKPLIGTNIGGIAMQIRDGWNGFLVEPRNEKQLAEKIRYLIDNPEERERMGENSRKLAREEFDWRKIAGRYLEIYEEVRNNGKG